jgi:hypothetical protein
MSKVQKVYRDIEQRLKDNPGKDFIAIARRDLNQYIGSLRAYQSEHRSCTATLEKEETSTALVTTTTEVQRFKAEIAKLRSENEELKTGSVSRTLGTPLDDSAPEPADLEAAVEQVSYLIDHPEYLRLATTRALVRTLTSFQQQARRHIDDHQTHFPHVPQNGDDSNIEGHELRNLTNDVRQGAQAQPGRSTRLLEEAVEEWSRWLDQADTTRATSPVTPGLEIIRVRQQSPISEPSSPKEDQLTVFHPEPQEPRAPVDPPTTTEPLEELPEPEDVEIVDIERKRVARLGKTRRPTPSPDRLRAPSPQQREKGEGPRKFQAGPPTLEGLLANYTSEGAEKTTQRIPGSRIYRTDTVAERAIRELLDESSDD